MVVNALTKPTQEQIAAEARDHALWQAEERLKQQYDSDRVEGERQNAQVAERRREVEERSIESLAELKPLYIARAQAAIKLAAALSEFSAAEDSIKVGLKPIADRLANVWSGQWPDSIARKMIDLRIDSGLLATHEMIGTDGLDRLARTVCRGIVGGAIVPGAIVAGSVVMNIE